MTARRTQRSQKAEKAQKSSRCLKFKRNFKEAWAKAVLSDKESRERQHFSLTDISHFNNLLAFFNENFFSAIELKNIEGADWKTRRYATPPRNLLEQYNDTNLIIGLRFNTLTRVLICDIDCFSPYHPRNDELAYRRLLGILEDIGLVGYEVIQSSNSGGIHLYIPLPKPVPSWLAAHALTVVLQKAGFTLAKGKLELFPNRKGYSPEHVTYFHGIRLPLQPKTGSYILDPFDFCPVHDDLKAFVAALHHHAKRQDMATFRRTMKAAYEDFYVDRYTGKVRRNSTNGVPFHDDLLTRILPGWTGYGQTNDLVFEAVKYSYIFRRLDGPDLVRETAAWLRSLPGYEEYCGHKHNLEQRVRDWLKSTKALGYYPYTGEYRPRGGVSYGDTVQATIAAQREDGRRHNKANSDRQQTARQKLAAVIRLLRQEIRQGTAAAPQTVRALLDLIIGTAKQHFGTGFSQQFLYRFKGLLSRLKNFAAKIIQGENALATSQDIEQEVATLQNVIEPLKTLESGSESALQAISDENTSPETPETQLQGGFTGNFANNEGWESSYPPQADACFLRVGKELVDFWRAAGTALIYTGNTITSVVKFITPSSSQPIRKSRVLKSGTLVQLTPDVHSMESSRGLVYVKPVRQNWLEGIPVLFGTLIPKRSET